MAVLGGLVGKILRVDLTKRTVAVEPTANYADRFLGGMGIGLKIYWNEVSPNTKAFDPENLLMFLPGVLTGTASPSSGRLLVMGKSPHIYPTETYATSGIGGQVAMEMKFAGYDAVVVKGKASSPVYLKITDGTVEILDATALWGMDTYEAQKEIKKQLNNTQYKILVIGPSGENLVRFASILTDTGHAAGQGGFGAVMGSKNLKAVAIRGTGKVDVAFPERLMNLIPYVTSLVTSLGITYKNSALWYDRSVDPHDTHKIPLRYRSTIVGYNGGLDFAKKYGVKATGCASCPVSDYLYVNVPGVGAGEGHCMQWYYGWLSGKMDETAWAVKIIHDKLGVNVYELVYMIPFLRNLKQRGLINEEVVGIPITSYPELPFMTALLNKITYREGIGDVLAEGVPRAAEKMGLLDWVMKEEPQYAASYGGHGMCIHYDARDWIEFGLLWATDARDPFHDKHTYTSLMHWSGLSYEEKEVVAEYAYGSKHAITEEKQSAYSPEEAKATIIDQDRSCVKEILGLCDWVFPIILSPLEERNYLGDTSIESQLYSAVTGIELTEAGLYNLGERLWNLERAILVREGRRRDGDTLPDYFFTLNSAAGSPAINKEKWNKLKDSYYTQRGWNTSTGIPTRAKLEALNLKDIADGLEGAGISL